MIMALLAGASISAVSGDWRGDSPGAVHHISPSLPAPSRATAAPSAVVSRPRALPRVPAGFTVSAFASLEGPRQIRAAPNGDLFVAETDAGRVTVLRAADGAAKAATASPFAVGLDRPFGIAFWPPGPAPRFVYVATNNQVLRYPYKSGDLKALGSPATIIDKIADTTGGHTTRDVAFSPDGRTMYVSVGSGSNTAESMPLKTAAEVRAWEAASVRGAAWGRETGRADILAFTPQGAERTIFADGIRNCVSMAIQPGGNRLWCAVNERDGLGDNLPPDYVTSVKAGGYYGWPWWYLGPHEDPRHKGERPDLAKLAIVPDVLIQAHSAPLGLTFYTAAAAPAAFPAAWSGDAFVALHGSWNRSMRTGYKVVRLTFKNGAPTGDYVDFLTGFVVDDHSVWGRPVGAAEARDGALMVTDDASGVVWRVAKAGAGR
ncbi:MAG: PQQ-dependent sugar dehydrogenase, partial [Caulobacteraceae bacterium]